MGLIGDTDIDGPLLSILAGGLLFCAVGYGCNYLAERPYGNHANYIIAEQQKALNGANEKYQNRLANPSLTNLEIAIQGCKIEEGKNE